MFSPCPEFWTRPPRACEHPLISRWSRVRSCRDGAHPCSMSHGYAVKQVAELRPSAHPSFAGALRDQSVNQWMGARPSLIDVWASPHETLPERGGGLRLVTMRRWDR